MRFQWASARALLLAALAGCATAPSGVGGYVDWVTVKPNASVVDMGAAMDTCARRLAPQRSAQLRDVEGCLAESGWKTTGPFYWYKNGGSRQSFLAEMQACHGVSTAPEAREFTPWVATIVTVRQCLEAKG